MRIGGGGSFMSFVWFFISWFLKNREFVLCRVFGRGFWEIFDCRCFS